jgi:hypothetical protein
VEESVSGIYLAEERLVPETRDIDLELPGTSFSKDESHH